MKKLIVLSLIILAFSVGCKDDKHSSKVSSSTTFKVSSFLSSLIENGSEFISNVKSDLNSIMHS